MSEPKHSLAPWSTGAIPGVIFDAHGGLVADAARVEDAPLIAAAPTLLHACKHALSAIEEGVDTDLVRLRSAIAAAEARP